MSDTDFTVRFVPALNRSVHRLGLACNQGIDAAAFEAALDRGLLKKPRGWGGAPMTAGDCYRFCLSSPHVDVTLCAPKNGKQLDDNLAALDRGPLAPDEDRWMRAFGSAVHG
jgi:hypothetical protein